MPYSKQKVKKLAKLERKFYSKYVLKFNILTLLNILKFDKGTTSTLSKVHISNSCKKKYVNQKYVYRGVRKSRFDWIIQDKRVQIKGDKRVRKPSSTVKFKEMVIGEQIKKSCLL